ncbi:ATP-binding protein [Thermobifida cellulosilytica]|uniref:Histidine kinase/HSP90-like ATPase domain-containing protein n=1 Tax=Thermobifida cellulosilytica TB100 TaxID=665004 RepID=A0A147KKD3_THECS|nr:ATP-binding protein [Thermobifida cellulosilytica]KUP97747.1 hypothetical protein AC529_04585 [Thermobifida cellulosilytica TB100]
MSAKVFPGLPDSVAAARAFVVGYLRDSAEDVPEEAVERAELIVSELATNAVHHTRSGDPGGSYEVRVGVERRALRAEVRTAQPRAHTVPHVVFTADNPLRESGRGMFLVNLLATRWGTLAAPVQGVYFVLRWPDARLRP